MDSNTLKLVREALLPLTGGLRWWKADAPDEAAVPGLAITFGQMRRARQALAALDAAQMAEPVMEQAKREAAMLREIADSPARASEWKVNLTATADFLATIAAPPKETRP